MATNTRTFTDIDMAFAALPVSGDIATKIDEAAIKQALRNLVLTKNFERPFHPEIGSQVLGLLFENYTPLTRQVLEQSITNVILNFEPRVKLLQVKVTGRPDENGVDVQIMFNILNTVKPIQLDISLKRTR